MRKVLILLLIFLSCGRIFRLEFLKSARGIKILSPKNNAEIGFVREINFDWENAKDTTKYEIQVANDKDFSSLLCVIDIQNFLSLKKVGYYDTPGYALDVYVVGNYAYVVDYDCGLRVIKVNHEI